MGVPPIWNVSVDDVNKYLNKVGLRVKSWDEQPIKKAIDHGREAMGTLKQLFTDPEQQYKDDLAAKAAEVDKNAVADTMIPNSTERDVYQGSHTQQHSGDSRLALRRRDNVR